MRKSLRTLHLILAFPLGLVIVVICLSGMALAFEADVAPLLQPKQARVEQVGTASLPASQLVDRVSQTLPDTLRATSITYRADKAAPVSVSYNKGRHSAKLVDPYTGVVIGEQERHPFFATMFRLHRWLLGKPGGAGQLVVGVSTALFALALLSGLVLWWPKSWAVFRKKSRIVTGRGRQPLFYSLHGTGGFYALIFLLLLSLTGLTWSFPAYNKVLFSAVGLEVPQRGGAPSKSGGGQGEGHRHRGEGRGHQGGAHASRGAGKGAQEAGRAAHKGDAAPQPALNTAHWQSVKDHIAQAHPDWKEISIEDGRARVRLSLYGNMMARDSYTFDPTTGRILEHTPYAATPANQKLNGWIHSLHMGTFAGAFSRYLWAIVALIGACLPLTGYYLWYKRTFRRKSQPAA